MAKTKSVEDYIAGASRWRPELEKLRDVLRSTGLEETIKWGGPCYTHDGRNVVGIGGFKSYFGLWFFQGALLDDEKGHLINAQEGKTRAMRQWRMHSAKDIRPAIIRKYVRECVDKLDAGEEIRPVRDRPVVVPTELKHAFARRKKAATAFGRLRPGLQREYANYVAEAKREDTRQRRVEKILPMIEAGKGLNDRYR